MRGDWAVPGGKLTEWSENYETVPRCNCGAEVSPDYHRVFATNEGVLTGCQACMSASERRKAERDLLF